MVTGYDHLLFLVGVIFFLYRLKDVVQLRQPVHARPQPDAARRRAGRHPGQRRTSSTRSSASRSSTRRSRTWTASSAASASGPTRALAVLVFGLFHGFGLATKLQEFDAVAERPRRQHRQLQRRRRDRPGAGADRRAARADVLARAAWFLRHAFVTNAALMAPDSSSPAIRLPAL